MMNVAAKETFQQSLDQEAATIEIRLSRPQQLFNSLDEIPALRLGDLCRSRQARDSGADLTKWLAPSRAWNWVADGPQVRG